MYVVYALLMFIIRINTFEIGLEFVKMDKKLPNGIRLHFNVISIIFHHSLI